MGFERRLSDGRAKLCRSALAAREANGAWATAASACKVTSGRPHAYKDKFLKAVGKLRGSFIPAILGI